MSNIANNQAIVESGKHIPVIFPPKGILVLDANTDLASYDCCAIESSEDFQIYFGSNSDIIYVISANTPFGIHPTSQPKLIISGTFLVY